MTVELSGCLVAADAMPAAGCSVCVSSAGTTYHGHSLLCFEPAAAAAVCAAKFHTNHQSTPTDINDGVPVMTHESHTRRQPCSYMGALGLEPGL
jgi:hypothetical protein